MIFNEEWKNRGFNQEETMKWINLGFEQGEYELADFAKNHLNYSAEDIESILNGNISIEEIFGPRIQKEQFEDSQIQEAINRSLNISNQLGEESDIGWLTDDNIEYILKNDEITKQAKNIQIKTDIANIYFQVDKAKKGEEIDEEFLNSLDTKKKYIILPLRVSGNHWSILLFTNNSNGRVNWLYYISSLGISVANLEVKEIENFLKQVGKKFGTIDNIIINENNLSEMVFQENSRQPNTWDCGVYLCKFIQFLCENDYYKLNECQITNQELKEFRDKWREKIGENKWCKWDDGPIQSNSEDDQLQEILKLSLETSREDKQIQEALLLSSLEENYEQKTEVLRKELETERVKNTLLSKKLELLELVSQAKVKLNDNDRELLDELLEAQEEYIQSNNQFAKKQFDKKKQKLLKNDKGIEQVCQLKGEIVKIENEQLEAKVQTSVSVPKW